MSLKSYPTKPCKYCGKTNHFPYQCYENPKRKRNNGIKQYGKYAKQWTLTRQTWIDKNPPPIKGKYWTCYLQIHEWCPITLTEDKLTLDHVVPRSHDPSKRFDLSNLKPACIYCNNQKGSKKLDQVK